MKLHAKKKTVNLSSSISLKPCYPKNNWHTHTYIYKKHVSLIQGLIYDTNNTIIVLFFTKRIAWLVHKMSYYNT